MDSNLGPLLPPGVPSPVPPSSLADTVLGPPGPSSTITPVSSSFRCDSSVCSSVLYTKHDVSSFYLPIRN